MKELFMKASFYDNVISKVEQNFEYLLRGCQSKDQWMYLKEKDPNALVNNLTDLLAERVIKTFFEELGAEDNSGVVIFPAYAERLALETRLIGSINKDSLSVEEIRKNVVQRLKEVPNWRKRHFVTSILESRRPHDNKESPYEKYGGWSNYIHTYNRQTWGLYEEGEEKVPRPPAISVSC